MWSGKSEETYPWGKETDLEAITYLAADNHPEVSSVQGDAEILMALKQQTLSWRGHLMLTSDAKNFYYKYTRQLFKTGSRSRKRSGRKPSPGTISSERALRRSGEPLRHPKARVKLSFSAAWGDRSEKTCTLTRTVAGRIIEAVCGRPKKIPADNSKSIGRTMKQLKMCAQGAIRIAIAAGI